MEQYYAEAKDSPSDCDSSMDSAQDTQAHFPKSFLFHVIGQQLTASPFILPYEKEPLIKLSILKLKQYILDTVRGEGTVDVGGKILQVTGCFDGCVL